MNSLKSLAINCGPLSEMMRWFGVRVFLLGGLENDLDVGFPHRLAQVPVHDRAAVAVQHAAEVVEGARDVDVGNVDMPMLMRLGRLFEARPFQRLFAVPLAQQARPAQHPPDARRADGHDVGVEHHERQPPVALQRMLAIKVYDGLFFPLFEPEIPGNPNRCARWRSRSAGARNRTCWARCRANR